MKAVRLKAVDMDYRIHKQAFLNLAVKAEKKVGKRKSRPVYTKFKKFYDYEKEIRQALGEKRPADSRFQGIEKLLRKN